MTTEVKDTSTAIKASETCSGRSVHRSLRRQFATSPGCRSPQEVVKKGRSLETLQLPSPASPLFPMPARSRAQGVGLFTG